MHFNFQILTILTLAGSLLIGCSNKKEMSEGEFNNLVTSANAKALQENPLPEMVKGLPLRPKAVPTPITNKFKSKLCDFVADDHTTSSELSPYFSNSQAVNAVRQQLSSLQNSFSGCQLKKTAVSAYPLEISLFDLDGFGIYLISSLDHRQRISWMYLLPANDGLKIEEKYLPTSDGTKLHTVVVTTDDNKKRGTVFLKTPYFETNNMGYFVSGYQYFIQNGFNFVMQSNRGAHLSEGDFKWLDPVNVEDSNDTIDWIAKQDFSNGKVMSYGVSYDGYNALAANVSNHPALKSVVACSAPANAGTDSFSSNKSMEFALLIYIAGREQAQLVLSQQAASAAMASADIHDWDNILYGRDLGDWDATIEAIKDIDSDYWKERSLVEQLKQSSIETLHVAGLSYDQDSRDTVLAYEEIQNKGTDSEKHRLFLHSGGHGCGGIEQSQVMQPYLSLISDSPAATISLPQVMQFSFASGSWVSGDSYPLEELIEKKEMILSLEEGANGELTSSNSQVLATMIEDPTSDLGEDHMAFLSAEITEDIYVNGSMEIVLKATSEAPETRISAKVYYSLEDVQLAQIQRYEWGLARSSAVTTENPQDELAMIYPPRLLKLKAGTKVYVHLLTNDNSHIQALSPEREQFFTSQNKATVSILEGAKLVLPIEKVQAPAVELASN